MATKTWADIKMNMDYSLRKLEEYIIENYEIDGSSNQIREEEPPRQTASDTPLKEGNLGSVWINATQHFANVPEVAWSFYIGGYQPAQKWLKDRKDRKLEFDDILHYQKIIVALSETSRIMSEIDKIAIE